MQSPSVTCEHLRINREDAFTKQAEKEHASLSRIIGSLVSNKTSRGYSILLLGPPSVGKTVFCENLVKFCQQDKLAVLYVSLDKSPDDIKNDLQHLGLNVSLKSSRKSIVFIDGFNWLIGEFQEEFHVDNLGNLTELSIQIASAAESLSEPPLLIFDSISPLLVYNPENVVVKFLQILLAKIRNWRGFGFFVVQDGVHSDGFCNTLSYLVDGIFDMKIKEENDEISRHFRIRSLKSIPHDTKWIQFEIKTNREIKLKLNKVKKVAQ